MVKDLQTLADNLYNDAVYEEKEGKITNKAFLSGLIEGAVDMCFIIGALDTILGCLLGIVKLIKWFEKH